jgi:hypothetical protein
LISGAASELRNNTLSDFIEFFNLWSINCIIPFHC